MKKIAFCLVLSTFLVSCKKNVESQNVNSTSIENSKELNKSETTVAFDKVVHDFGVINQGEIVETVFVIKNTGKNDLYIFDAFATCGCTVPKVSKDPIKPGDSTPISVKFDSNGKSGIVEKTVNVRCNTKNLMEQVKIKANIKTKN